MKKVMNVLMAHKLGFGIHRDSKDNIYVITDSGLDACVLKDLLDIGIQNIKADGAVFVMNY